jgi:hypothetical protein
MNTVSVQGSHLRFAKLHQLGYYELRAKEKSLFKQRIDQIGNIVPPYGISDSRPVFPLH